LRDAQGLVAGRAELAASGGDSTVVTVRAGASTGPRGVHLHAVGRCDAPSFASAGAHLNPFAHLHGRQNPRGAHAGDLPNLPSGGTLTFTLAVPFDSILDVDGSAVVVHANADDEMTDPSGNSGPRMLCGAFQPASGRRTAP
jgi:Cu-Zn family superoxide dismutase